MKTSDIALGRLRNQRLSSPDFKNAADVVHWLGAVQAQDYYAAKWALGLRMRAASDQGLEKAFAAGEILRTHVMRPTWHFVSPTDIRWLLKLTAPRVNAAAKYNYRKLELDEAVFKRANKAITKALLGGNQLTRESLRAAVQRAGVLVDDLLRFTHILLRAELDGLICSGARQGKQFTYALLEERVPETKAPPSREQALADLTQRYFTSHGPATLPDFAWWSGLTVKDASSGIDIVQRHLVKEVIADKTYWRSASALPEKRSSRMAHLLPPFDEYLISYKDRSAALEGDNKQAARDNVLFRGVIVIDGRAVGSWKRSLEADSVRLTLNYFSPVSKTEGQLVAQAADRYAAFLGLSVVLD